MLHGAMSAWIANVPFQVLTDLTYMSTSISFLVGLLSTDPALARALLLGKIVFLYLISSHF